MSRRIGKGPCPNCGADIIYKVNQKEHLYAYCHHPADGGCGSGTTSRSEKGDELLARKVVKWDSAEERKKWLPENSDQPPVPPEESELEEAEEEGELEVQPPAPEPPAPPPPRQNPSRSTLPASSAPAQRQPAPRTKPAARRPAAPKPAGKSLVDDWV